MPILATSRPTMRGTASVRAVDVNRGALQNRGAPGPCPLTHAGGVAVTIAHEPPVGETPSFAGANLSDADFARSDLAGADFTGASLAGADFTGANLDGAVLRGADLAGVLLVGANASLADLRRCDLTSADLTGANLTEALLDGCRLVDAVLAGADARSASFLGAQLTGADLSSSNLTGAALSGANLTDANLAAATGAAIAVFHARAAQHVATGRALEAIARDLGLDDYCEQVEPELQALRQQGMTVTAPGTSQQPSSISWSDTTPQVVQPPVTGLVDPRTATGPSQVTAPSAVVPARLRLS